MPLVHVIDLRSESQGLQGTHPTHAEKDLLADPDVAVAAIQTKGRDAVSLFGLRNVRVKEEQRHPANLDPPYLGGEYASGEIHRDLDRRTVRPTLKRHRQVVEVVVRIELTLPSVGVEILAEVPLLIRQTDSHEGNAQI
jgi:hypothetical protein